MIADHQKFFDKFVGKKKSMSLQECFEESEDSRNASGLRHPLVPFLCMLTMSQMSGFHGFRASAEFMKGNEAELVEIFQFKHGTPGSTQTGSIIKGLDFKAINEVFFKWINRFVTIEKGEWVAGDGKSLNSTVIYPNDSRQDFSMMVRLFAVKLGIVVQTERIRNKKGEKTALKKMLETLALKGVTITLDALYCEKK